MDTNKHELILKEETFDVVGCAIEVLNELGQMVNYLKITQLKAGLIIKFKRPKLEWKRVVC